MSLRADLLRDRRASYVRWRGGYLLPLSGVVYWIGLGFLGARLSPQRWTLWALILTGSVFPLGFLFGMIFRDKLMQERTAVTDVLVPALISTLLFWPMAIAAARANVQLVPLILGIGMSLLWPVVGWMFGRTALYSTHSIVRALVCFSIWWWVPEGRFTWLPASVGILYAFTAAAILIDSSRVQRRLTITR